MLVLRMQLGSQLDDRDHEMTTRIPTRLLLGATFSAVAAACAPRAPVAAPPSPVLVAPAPAPVPVARARAPFPEMNPALPPVPHVTGALEIKVVYPTAGQLIESKDFTPSMVLQTMESFDKAIQSKLGEFKSQQPKSTNTLFQKVAIRWRWWSGRASTVAVSRAPPGRRDASRWSRSSRTQDAEAQPARSPSCAPNDDTGTR